MELENLNKLYCELSQVVTAKSAREIALEKTADARAQFIEYIYQSYKDRFSQKDIVLMGKILAEWKPQNYAQY